MKTKDEARTKAIEIQQKLNEVSCSWGELSVTQDYLYKLGKRFGLIREFKENGLI